MCRGQTKTEFVSRSDVVCSGTFYLMQSSMWGEKKYCAVNREYCKVESQKLDNIKYTQQTSKFAYFLSGTGELQLTGSECVCKMCVFIAVWFGLALTTVINDPAVRAMCHVVSPPAASFIQIQPTINTNQALQRADVFTCTELCFVFVLHKSS